MRLHRVVSALTFVLGLSTTGAALGDVAPPPGLTRVRYAFRATGSAKGVVLIAYPMLGRGSNGRTVALALDEDAVPMQGYTPGIYSVTAEDAATLAGTVDEGAFEALLAKKAHLCVKAVPRVFAVPTTTLVTSITDVFRVDATVEGCKASFAKTVYGGEGGVTGEGTVDPSGHRLAPPPFGSSLPDTGDMGLSLAAQPKALPSAAPPATSTPSATPTSTGEKTAPAHGGCAGCAVSKGETTLGWLGALGLGLALGARRRSRVATRS